MNNKVKDLYNGKDKNTDRLDEVSTILNDKKPRTIGDIHYDYLDRMFRKKKNQDRMKKKLMLREESSDEG